MSLSARTFKIGASARGERVVVEVRKRPLLQLCGMFARSIY